MKPITSRHRVCDRRQSKRPDKASGMRTHMPSSRWPHVLTATTLFIEPISARMFKTDLRRQGRANGCTGLTGFKTIDGARRTAILRAQEARICEPVSRCLGDIFSAKMTMPWENHLAGEMPTGSRLPPNIKTYDFFDRATGTATSAYTLKTTSDAKLANPGAVKKAINKKINAIIDFREYTLLDVTVTASHVKARALQVAVPKATTPAQWQQINKAIQYGKNNDVTAKITVIE